MLDRMIGVINYNNMVKEELDKIAEEKNMVIQCPDIALTEEQKEAILACGRAFKGFADAMRCH